MSLSNLNRFEILNKIVNADSTSDNTIKMAVGEKDSIELIRQRDQFFSILRKWANNEIEFSSDMMKKYSPRYNDKTSFFANVGHPSLQTFESRFDPTSKFYGLSHGRTWNEFIQDSKNPNFQLPDQKPETVDEQVQYIHLYNKKFDNEKQQYYWELTHINQPFNYKDVINLQNNPSYKVQPATNTPIRTKQYISDDVSSNVLSLSTNPSAFSNEQPPLPSVLPFRIYQKEDIVDTIDTSIMQQTAGDPDPKRKTTIKLSQKLQLILKQIQNKEVIVPDWFIQNNVKWVKTGKISEQEFFNAFYTVNTLPLPPIVDPPPPPVSIPTITQNMVNQDFNDFQMFNNKIVGSITYNATKHFNPHYFYDFKSNTGAILTSLLIVEDEKHVSILQKENQLRFSDLEKDELINYNINIPNDVNFVYLKTMVFHTIDDSRPFSNIQAIELGVNKPYYEKKRDNILGNAVGVIIGAVTLSILASKR